MKNVDAGKDFLPKMLWEMQKVIEKSLVPKFKMLVIIYGLFEAQFSTSFYKMPKHIKIFMHSK